MKKRHGRIARYFLTAAIAAALTFTTAVPAAAATKEEVQSQIDDLKSQQSQLSSKLSELKKNKSNTESYISELDKEIKEYASQLEDISEDITKTDAEIDITTQNLDQAKKDEKTQYDALKARIKAMYEAGDEDYVEMILNADDIKSLLNNAEYSSKINEYDHELLTELQETEEKIAKYEKELEDQKALQVAQKQKYELEKQDVEKIVSQKEEELVSIGSNIDSVSSDMSNTQDEINEENGVLQQIVEQERLAAEAAARKQAEEEAAAEAAAEKAKSSAAASKASSSSSNSSGNYSSSSSSSDSSSSSSGSSYNNDEDSDSGSSSSSYSSSGMIWPVGSTSISSYFGYRSAPTAGATTYHQGIDISASEGSSIYAAASGTVTTVAYNSAMGNYVVISHGNGVCTIYEHCSSIYVSDGQSVSQGSTIAAVGSTGVATGAHLHFGVTVGGSYVNPLSYVSP